MSVELQLVKKYIVDPNREGWMPLARFRAMTPDQIVQYYENAIERIESTEDIRVYYLESTSDQRDLICAILAAGLAEKARRDYGNG